MNFNIPGEIDDLNWTSTFEAEHIGQDPFLCCRRNCTPQNSGLERKLSSIHLQEHNDSASIQQILNYLERGQPLSNPPCQTQDMKVKNVIPERPCTPTVIRFGEAKLLEHSPGRYELIGGSEADQATAIEWASFFGHEIVISPPSNPPSP